MGGSLTGGGERKMEKEQLWLMWGGNRGWG